MFLKQIRTYVLVAIVLCIYGYFLYLPFRTESMNNVILDYSRAIGSLQVGEPMYGSDLNDVLNQNLKLRSLFFNRFRDSHTPANQMAYWQAESMTHQIQLQLLILSLNHDLYMQTGGTVNEQPSLNDYQQIESLIHSLSAQNTGKADDLQKTAYRLIKDKGENLGGIYVLAHDMVLMTQMNDPFNKLLWQTDYEMINKKLDDLLIPQSDQPSFKNGQIQSSFINAVVDDAISSIQTAGEQHADMKTDPMGSIAMASYEVPTLSVEKGKAYVKMTGVDNGVIYRSLVGSAFTWDVPNGKYDVEIDRDGDYVWKQTLQISSDQGFVADLVRSDQTLLSAFKPSIMEAIQQISYNLLDFIKQSDEPQAALTYMSFEQVVEKIPTGEDTHAVDEYKKDIQPENTIHELRQLNEQLYNIVNGHGSTDKQWDQMIADVFPLSQTSQVKSIWTADNSNAVKLDYTLIDVKAFKDAPIPSEYVTFVWFTPDMQKEAWNVDFQMVHGRWVVIGANKKVDKQIMSKFGTVYSYKQQNHTEYLQSIPAGKPLNLKQTCKDLVPKDANLSNSTQTQENDKVMTDKVQKVQTKVE